jgi:hypothetical protein
MTKEDFDSLPDADCLPNAAQQRRLYELAKLSRDRATRSYNSFVGADSAEAYVHDLIADIYGVVGSGKDAGAVIQLNLGKWRRYAADQNDRVDNAPKMPKRHPRGGQPVIAHRWVSPDLFGSYLPHVKGMIDKIKGPQR